MAHWIITRDLVTDADDHARHAAGDPMGHESRPSELYDGRVCSECSLLE